MTPDRWTRDTAWKHGPRKLVVSERPDPIQLPETAGVETEDHDVRIARLVAAGLVLLTILLVVREML